MVLFVMASTMSGMVESSHSLPDAPGCRWSPFTVLSGSEYGDPDKEFTPSQMPDGVVAVVGEHGRGLGEGPQASG